MLDKDLDTSKARLRAVHKLVLMDSVTLSLIFTSDAAQKFCSKRTVYAAFPQASPRYVIQIPCNAYPKMCFLKSL
ncbi:hypothetical protein [Desulfovulcanus sp.]